MQEILEARSGKPSPFCSIRNVCPDLFCEMAIKNCMPIIFCPVPTMSTHTYQNFQAVIFLKPMGFKSFRPGFLACLKDMSISETNNKQKMIRVIYRSGLYFARREELRERSRTNASIKASTDMII
ncbi:hypothetical protein M9H77_05990 [Catharanthus roseus]|uniref:Uncharacterized protein n=1 Tax=Catharanthus roseus TaxID=4058 RepID=A0ACC0BQV1_CATRO|nr:hypothetical protein M9H77_05990 [Catharanthus roseus]